MVMRTVAVLSQRPVKGGRRKQIIHETKFDTRVDERKKRNLIKLIFLSAHYKPCHGMFDTLALLLISLHCRSQWALSQYNSTCKNILRWRSWQSRWWRCLFCTFFHLLLPWTENIWCLKINGFYPSVSKLVALIMLFLRYSQKRRSGDMRMLEEKW